MSFTCFPTGLYFRSKPNYKLIWGIRKMSSHPDPYWVKSCPPKNTALGEKKQSGMGRKIRAVFHSSTHFSRGTYRWQKGQLHPSRDGGWNMKCLCKDILLWYEVSGSRGGVLCLAHNLVRSDACTQQVVSCHTLRIRPNTP